jgi:hypothetical protein
MLGGMMDLQRWTEKLAQLVRRICSKKSAPCVGISLVFFDPTAPKEKQWNYVIELAFDPDNPPPEEEREMLTKAFEYINAGVQRIFGGHEIDDSEIPNDYSARANFH